jgi:hypothetical protein
LTPPTLTPTKRSLPRLPLALGVLLLSIPLAIYGLGLAGDPTAAPRAPGTGEEAERAGLRIVRLSGTPEEIGRQMGTSFRDEIKGLVPAMLRQFGVGPEQRAAARLLELQVPEAYRRELQACALAAEVDYEDLLVANLVVEAFCSVVVAPPARARPLRVARNLDFHPASLLGDATAILIVAPEGKRPFVSVGWPGFNSVTSGFNADGLSTFVLINLGSPEVELATPIGYRQRQVLEECADLAQGAQRFQASAVASGHYVVLADTGASCTLYRSSDGFRRLDPNSEGTLLCSNGAADPESGQIDDARTRALGAFLAERGWKDAGTLREALGVSYLVDLNAQAMVVEPATARLDLALGTTLAPAALQRWVRLDLGPALRGEPLTAIATEQLPPPGEVTHFTRE